MAKLFEADRIKMRQMRVAGSKLQQIADYFGCTVGHVSQILSRRIGVQDKPEIAIKPGPSVPAITVQQPGSILRPIPLSVLMGGNARRTRRVSA